MSTTFQRLFFFDHEQDGKYEITGVMGSSNNQDSQESTLFPDDSTWLMVYNENLELINEPIGFSGPFATIYPLPVLRGNKTELLIYLHYNGDNGFKNSLSETLNLHSIVIKDTVGNRIKSIAEGMHRMISGKDTSYFVVSNTGSIVFYDHNIEYQKLVDINANLNGHFAQLDLTSNGHNEIFLSEKFTDDFLVISDKGRLLCRHIFDDTEFSLSISGLVNHYGQTKAWVQKGNNIYFYTMHRNYLYGLRWLVLIGLISLFYILALTFKWIQRKQTFEKEELSKQINALQLQSVKNQLDPHFTFNALNVLNYLSRENDTKGIESFTNHFSKLLRRQIEMSDKPYTSLYDEIQFVEHYLELQKLRFDIPISYELNVKTNSNMNLRIPKMMIHTHVENAIKHGIIPAEGGKITIRIYPDNKVTIIEIEDNGVGRKSNSNPATLQPFNPVSSTGQAPSTGKGLAILDQLYDLYYQLYKVRIRQEVVDLVELDSEKSGTLIRIEI